MKVNGNGARRFSMTALTIPLVSTIPKIKETQNPSDNDYDMAMTHTEKDKHLFIEVITYST